MKPISKEAVLIVDKQAIPLPNGGVQHRFRLSITPMDLRQIIEDANRLGLNGQKVSGFGYDYESNSVLLGPPISKGKP